jgi:hypothetical protein
VLPVLGIIDGGILAILVDLREGILFERS